MILTPRFVFIHQPKTGGTFVTRVLYRLLGDPLDPTDPSAPIAEINQPNQHGSCREIPASHRGIPILATVRNPFERYVSQYEFAWWRQDLPPWVDVDAVRAEYPHFPNLSFEEFVTGSELLLQQYRNSAVPPDRRLGLQSEQFVRFFFRQPEVFAEIDDHYIEERRFEVDVFPVTFLRTHRLNQDLHDYLVAVGFEPDRVGFILDTPRVRPPGLDGETRDWSAVHHESHYYTPELRRLVRTREKLLLAMFPEFDA